MRLIFTVNAQAGMSLLRLLKFDTQEMYWWYKRTILQFVYTIRNPAHFIPLMNFLI